MKLSDLHPEDQKLFLEAFTSNPEVIARQDEINSLIADKQFIQAFKAKQELAKFQDEVFQNWVKTIEFRAEKIDVNKSNLPQEVKDKVNMLYVVAFMGCDLIVNAVVDMNDEIKKCDPDLRFEIFDDLAALAKGAQEKLNFLNRNSDYLKNMIWGTQCDDLYKMCQSKAKSIMRKNKELKEKRHE